jgi:EAL domain-containing protein (putative c-di-GMP-specific phosphodiesterase class I)
MRIELDRWVLQSAITTIATDHYARENACLFIHLANETLAQKSFFSFATNVLRSSRLRGQGRLVFIFEEPWIAANVEDAAAIIHSLHNIQCGACLSHAGSTEETENIIKNHHFDYVRLAPSLTAPLLENSAPYLKMQRIIQLVHEAESAVIATHVEDAKSLAQLWQMGIRLFQGFLLQTPEPQIRNHSDIDSLKRLIKASSANES